MSGTNSSQSRSKREKRIQTGKLIGDMLMYIGSAAITSTALQKVRKNQNAFMSACATGTGAMLSIGAGRIASNVLNKVIDRTIDFIDDVKPKDKKSDTTEEPKEENDTDDSND